MGHLSTAELKLDAHLMAFSEEVFRMHDLNPIVMGINANTELHFLHLAAFVVLVGFLLLLFQRVFVLAVVDDFADGWIDVWGDLNEIDAAFPGHTKSNRGHKNAILLVGAAINNAHFRSTNTLIDASLIHITSIRRTSVSLLTWAIKITSWSG